MIIAIDGPAGAGKSSVSKALAARLGFKYVDTGAIYRAVTLKVMNEGLNLEDEEAICELIDNTQIGLEYIDSKLNVLLDNVVVTDEIRSQNVTNNIFFISNKAAVRNKLIKHQKDCTGGVDAVVEGRDIGTVIFPDAEKKFFLNADVTVRAKRRYCELVRNDPSVELTKILEDIKLRDNKDSTRQAAPLKKEKDAVSIDTTNLTFDEVVDSICDYLDMK